MKILKPGVYKNKELADWFGMTANSFSRSKTKKLNELKNFCDFKILDNGKIKIDEVYEEEYSKLGSEAYRLIRDEVDEVWSESGLDSCSRVGMEIGDKLKNELMVTDSTIYNYTRKSRNELYGVPNNGRGKLGRCTYIWCKKIGDGVDAKYEYLTDEEEAIRQELMTKYFKESNTDIEKKVIVKGLLLEGKISKEKAWDILEEEGNLNTGNYKMFLQELRIRIGAMVVRGTDVERDRDLIEWEE